MKSTTASSARDEALEEFIIRRFRDMPSGRFISAKEVRHRVNVGDLRTIRIEVYPKWYAVGNMPSLLVARVKVYVGRLGNFFKLCSEKA